jgi:hypothetical protein
MGLLLVIFSYSRQMGYSSKPVIIRWFVKQNLADNVL